jgi:outer membrane biogenesis lipoprotein LolB
MNLRLVGRARLATFALLLAMNLLACAVPRPAVSRLPTADPDRVLEMVREREDRLTSLRARFTADSQREGERHSAEGVLLVKKPDRFRLRLMLPLGLTIFDYVSCGDRTQLALPMENKIISGPPRDNRLAFSQEDLGEAFLRGPNAFPGTCRTNGIDASGVVVTCRDIAGGLLRQMHIDAETVTIRDETTYEGDEPRMVIRYDDYRSVGDMALPYHVVLRYPGQHVALDVAIHRYEVNPVLADDLFRPVEPWAGS